MEPIAIIGIGCRYPKANNPESFWQLLRSGCDAIAQVPKDRWDIDAFYDPEPGKPGKLASRWGGFLDRVDRFDSNFFRISPREVERMDPQQRLVLEVAWEALENAGIEPSQLSGSQTGVFVGIGNYDYCRLLAKDISLVNAYDGTGNTLSIAANRLSYILNLKGPSVVTETACSSSLVALHYACQSLHIGESNACLVGGVSLMLSPEPTIAYSHARMLSPEGRCKTFDASADGYVRGEGCGFLVLKRLESAKRDKDNILAVIKGTAVNQDGQSHGLTAPNGPSQQAAIRQALKNAGVSPNSISYVEAHGTGTPLGDPIEYKSLKAVLMKDRKPDQPCWLGSVKTNIGHLEAAAGIAGVIKVVLSLQHREIPPHLHLKELNPYISLEGTTFSIPTECQPWSIESERRLAGVSAFGFGGTNCHVILEEAPDEPALPEFVERPLHLISLSAKSDRALNELAQRYVDFLVTHPTAYLPDICFTANAGRQHFDCRLAVVTGSTEQLREQLSAFACGTQSKGLISNQVQTLKPPKVAFLFTGQGSQYANMARELYETQPVFRACIDRCDQILRPHLETPLLSLLYPHSPLPTPHSPFPNDTAYTQPALFALEYALYELWKSWGVEPTAVMGHSLGEYVAACVAGVFSLEDGLKLIASRARLMQSASGNGEMVAVLADESKVQAAIETALGTDREEISIAAINGPQSIVISGLRSRIEAVVSVLSASGIKTKKLSVSGAFHSQLMSPILPAFAEAAKSITYSSPRLKIVSNLTGKVVSEEIATPEYWCDHLLQPVQFARSMETLYQQGYEVFVEIGPEPILLGMGRQCLPDGVGIWLPSLHQKQQDWQVILQSLGQLYARGIPVDWYEFDRNYPRRRLQLPTYPFQRERYWVDIQKVSESSEQTSIVNLLTQTDTKELIQNLATTGELSSSELKLLPKLLDLLAQQNQAASIKDWFYEIQWQPKPRKLTHQEKNGFGKPGTMLIFADMGGTGSTLAKLLRDREINCILVYPGTSYQMKEAGTWIVNPNNPADFQKLFQDILKDLDRPLQGIVHLWSLQSNEVNNLTIESLEQAQTVGVASVLHLLSALPKSPTPHSPLPTPRLWLMTQGAIPLGRDPVVVAQAPLWGLGKVVALEYPELWGGMLDLDPQADVETQLIESVLAEIEDPQGEDHLAFRNGIRYVARLIQTDSDRSFAPKFRLQSNATYLITGGLGALGLSSAQWMVKQGARHLVLTGRRQPNSETQNILNELEQTGVQIVVAQADVTSLEEMTRVLEEIQASMPPLRGIIHAAGVPGYEPLKDMSVNTLESVLRPKVVGTWILHQLTQAITLDFFVNFSSISSVWGSKGQAHYAAANHFLDVLAHYRRQKGLPALSVNWGPWAGGGMAVEEFQTWMQRMGVEVLQPEQAFTALGQLLASDCVQATVASVDWSQFANIYEVFGARSLLEQLRPKDATCHVSTSTVPTVQRSPILEKLENAALSDRHSLLINHLQNETANVLKLSQQPDPQQGLFEMGMDSLMAVELVGLIRSQLQVELPIAEFIQASNITTLAVLLLKQLTPEDYSTIDVVENVLDLDGEAVLDNSIYPGETLDIETNSILLTGATGFLGAFLLQELLKETNATIYCLVRAKNSDSAKEKIENNLRYYDRWNPEYSSRIVGIIGDLSQPRLGIAAEEFEQLARQIDVIYHNGAVLNFVYPYSALKSSNVLGTQEIIRLACQYKVKPLHYVSTDAVFDSELYYGKEVKESEPIIHTKGIDLGYTQTKWVAEKLITIARERGLPVSIYRPPLIAGDSQTGIWNTDDFTCRFLKGCIQMGSMPNMNCGITLVPVDYVSRAIVYLSQQKESLGKAFHLNNPNYSDWSDVANWINELGYPVRQIDYEEWENELIKIVGSQDNALAGLLPFFLRRWSVEQLTFAGLGQRRVKLNCQQTVAELAGSSIICPTVDFKLLHTYFSYFTRNSFLSAPKIPIS